MAAARLLTFIAGLMVLTPGIGAAADLAPAATAAPHWIVTVGLEGQTVPTWPGAPTNNLRLVGVPLVSVRSVGTPPEFFGPRDSFGFGLIDLGQLQLGPALKFVPSRKAADDLALEGLGDVGHAIEAGGFAEFWPEPWLRLRGELRQGFGGENGLTGDAFLDAIDRIGALTLSAGPRLTLQSTAATAPYFSITPAQAAASTISGLPMLPVYRAGGGLFSVGAGTEGRYFWTPQLSGLAFVEYQRLAGDAANSPLVTERGSPNQFTIGMGITYSFQMRPLW